MAFDEILTQLGEFGTYQKRTLVLVCLTYIPYSGHKFAQVFYAGEVDYWCAPSELKSINCTSPLQAEEKDCADIIRNASTEHLQYGSDIGSVDACMRYRTGYNPTVACETGWIFDHSQYKSTIIEDFGLICDRNKLPHVAQSVYFVGNLVGSIVFGAISDFIGRTRTMLITLIIWFSASVGTIFAPDVYTYMTLRFLVAFGGIGTVLSALVLGTEFVGPSRRHVAAISNETSFSIGIMVLAGLAYFIRDWRYLQLALTVPMVVFFIYIPSLYESARWLMSVGKYDEAEKVIRHVAKINKKELPIVLFDENAIAAQKDEKSRVRVLGLFKTSYMALKSINIMLNMFVNSLVYYGISLNIPNLGSDPYLAFFLSGLVELPAYVYAMWVIQHLGGRKVNFIGVLLVSGITCLLIGFLPPGIGVICVAMVGKFTSTVSFTIIYIYAVELFPTPVRNTGTGISSAFSHMGGAVAPLTVLLSETWPPLPFVFIGCFAISAALMSLLLPETRGENLPETLAEGEQFGKPDWMKRLCGNVSDEKTNDVELSATSMTSESLITTTTGGEH